MATLFGIRVGILQILGSSVKSRANVVDGITQLIFGRRGMLQNLGTGRGGRLDLCIIRFGFS